jgi:kynurenine formamidase
MKLIDLSHTIEHGMTTYPGLPAPSITTHLSREDSRAHYRGQAEFHIGRIDMVANTGTYLDAPSHRFAEGDDTSALPLEKIAALPAIVVDHGEPFPDVKGHAVLIRTNWSRHWGTEAYFHGHPFITKREAQYLADEGAVLVGIDSLNIDDISDLSRPAHTILLEAGVPIVEHLTNLDRLPKSGFQLFAVPPKVKGIGTFPVRAFAILP